MGENIRVADNPEASRYEVYVDDTLAGFADYRLRRDKIVFPHTEVRAEFEGRGLGGRLAQAALEASRDAGLTVVPACPFISAYIRRHPEFVELVDESYLHTVRSDS
ncbi:GNAT family N-acetyltransferase [Sinosporangium siamense]|uniref:N-acetyltransferase n=1 Tax=Sinosporangium siamense TaxID=1367973 RepID=A0A919V5N4_9ACTN|nr:GNAT family N-acetyltransferase [Sinosporangium siamense]GII93195.1 N-acetyltransferase [Sinosporangium siamense]